MTPMAEERTTATWRSGSLVLSEMAARKPALPPPTTRTRWIIGCLPVRGVKWSRSHLRPVPILGTPDPIATGRLDRNREAVSVWAAWHDRDGQSDFTGPAGGATWSASREAGGAAAARLALLFPPTGRH